MIFRAEYRPTLTHVAIKVYRKNSLTQTRENSIKHELHVLLSLEHPNVVRFIDCFSDRDHIYLVMELIRGRNLDASCKAGFQDLLPDAQNKIARKALTGCIFRQLASAAAFLHSRNVNHRDIKLDNIVFDPERRLVKLIDFGLTSACNLQARALLRGTPSYMSPEAVLKEEFRTLSADVWAMGVVYYALLFFRFPFNGRTDKELNIGIVEGEVEMPG